MPALKSVSAAQRSGMIASRERLTRIDAETNLASRVYTVGMGPMGIAVAQDELWVVMSDENSVWRIRP